MTARYSGVLGFVESQRTAPGVTEEVAREVKVFGDVLRDARKLEDSQERVNKNISIGNRLSVVVKNDVTESIYALRYATYKGTRWEITDVEVAEPRLILRLGAKYNGPIP